MNKPILNALPGQDESLSGTMRALFKMHGQNVDNLIPAKVVNYDRANNIATVQPQIMYQDTQDQQHSRGQLANIPVISLGGGGFTINFPLVNGDFGWILAADRDFTLFLQAMKESEPNTQRQHSFSDSWFIPDVFRQYTINSADSNAMVIQSLDGTTRISIRAGEIDIIAPSAVKVTTPKATFSQDVEIQGNLQVDKNTTVTGQTAVNGGFTSATGQNCTLPANTTCGGINVTSHGHNGVQSGSARTGGGMVA